MYIEFQNLDMIFHISGVLKHVYNISYIQSIKTCTCIICHISGELKHVYSVSYIEY